MWNKDFSVLFSKWFGGGFMLQDQTLSVFSIGAIIEVLIRTSGQVNLVNLENMQRNYTSSVNSLLTDTFPCK